MVNKTKKSNASVLNKAYNDFKEICITINQFPDVFEAIGVSLQNFGDSLRMLMIQEEVYARELETKSVEFATDYMSFKNSMADANQKLDSIYKNTQKCYKSYTDSVQKLDSIDRKYQAQKERCSAYKDFHLFDEEDKETFDKLFLDWQSIDDDNEKFYAKLNEFQQKNDAIYGTVKKDYKDLKLQYQEKSNIIMETTKCCQK